MQALVYREAEGKLELVADHPRPIAKEGEALIKVLCAGICSTVRPSCWDRSHRGAPVGMRA